MSKKGILLWLVLFCALQGSAQTDSLLITNTLPDTTALDNSRAVVVSEAAKAKIWPVIAVISTIIVSSFFLYNARSK